MKKFFIICISILLLLTSCRQANKTGIQTGDLVFVTLPAGYHLYNRDYEASPDKPESFEDLIIHTAIADVDKQGVWIIDATLAHGVDRHPLDTFLTDFTLKDGSYPVFEVMRLKDGPRDLVENAKKHIGEQYDSHFLPDNGASYCTELVRDSYLDKDGKPILPANPMNFKGPDGEFPVYWVQLFGILGSPIPQDIPGTNPQDMHASPLLKKVDVDITSLKR